MFSHVVVRGAYGVHSVRIFLFVTARCPTSGGTDVGGVCPGFDQVRILLSMFQKDMNALESMQRGGFIGSMELTEGRVWSNQMIYFSSVNKSSQFRRCWPSEFLRER